MPTIDDVGRSLEGRPSEAPSFALTPKGPIAGREVQSSRHSVPAVTVVVNAEGRGTVQNTKAIESSVRKIRPVDSGGRVDDPRFRGRRVLEFTPPNPPGPAVDAGRELCEAMNRLAQEQDRASVERGVRLSIGNTGSVPNRWKKKKKKKV